MNRMTSAAGVTNLGGALKVDSGNESGDFTSGSGSMSASNPTSNPTSNASINHIVGAAISLCGSNGDNNDNFQLTGGGNAGHNTGGRGTCGK